MSTTPWYRQCELKRQFEVDSDGCVIQEIRVAWIPEEYAVEGNYIRIRVGQEPTLSESPVEECSRSEDKKTWEDGWKITQVFNRLPADKTLSNSQDYKKQRKASDI